MPALKVMDHAGRDSDTCNSAARLRPGTDGHDVRARVVIDIFNVIGDSTNTTGSIPDGSYNGSLATCDEWHVTSDTPLKAIDDNDAIACVPEPYSTHDSLSRDQMSAQTCPYPKP